MKRLLSGLVLLSGLLLPSAGQAAKVEADPNKTYVAAPEVGPWMICVTTYSGPDGRQLARELAFEIRRRDNLPAYLYDRGEEQRRLQAADRERMRQLYPDADLRRMRTTRIQEECVVLIGGFKDMETARRELEKVKKLKPPQSEKLMPFLAEAQPTGDAAQRAEVKGTFLNPFPNSFVVRNPTVPAEKPVASQSEYQLLKHLNANEDYSLFKCRQPWTLVVASFQGSSVIQQAAATTPSFMDRVWGRGQGEALAASGQNAHNLAEVLRKLGYDAYVLHRRGDSLVTVGGFSSPEDPRIRTERERLAKGLHIGDPRIKLLGQPFAIEVPKP